MPPLWPGSSTIVVPASGSGRAADGATATSAPTAASAASRRILSLLTGRERASAEAEHAARDDEALDFARPLVDLRDLRVAVVALHRELLRVPVAAEHLDRLGRLPARHLRREELRLRARLGVRATLLLEPRRTHGEEPRRVDLRGHVRELVLD